MNADKFCKLFGIRRRRYNVEDLYGSILDDSPIDKKYMKQLAYYFGFKAKMGDMVCAVLLRKKKGVR